MAKWDGNSWDSLKNQNIFTPNDFIYDITVWNNQLVIGGSFNFPGLWVCA